MKSKSLSLPTSVTGTSNSVVAKLTTTTRRRYDTCFLKWYSEKFLRGNAQTDECAPLFQEYKGCLGKALKDRGINKMLADASKEAREFDAEHLRPG